MAGDEASFIGEEAAETAVPPDVVEGDETGGRGGRGGEQAWSVEIGADGCGKWRWDLTL